MKGNFLVKDLINPNSSPKNVKIVKKNQVWWYWPYQQVTSKLSKLKKNPVLCYNPKGKLFLGS